MVRDSAAKRREGEILTCILRTHTLNKLEFLGKGLQCKKGTTKTSTSLDVTRTRGR